MKRTLPKWIWTALIMTSVPAAIAVRVAMPASVVDASASSFNALPKDDGTPHASALTFEPTLPNAATVGPAPAGMVWIPGGEFSMGAAAPLGSDMSDVAMHATDDSRPVHRVYVDGFWMDRTEVTNGEFEAFVKATGYVTVAERVPTAADFPGAPPESLVAGSVAFSPPEHAVPLDSHFRGGSFLCTDQYCARYMVGTRGKGDPSTGTNHLGFRLIKDKA